MVKQNLEYLCKSGTKIPLLLIHPNVAGKQKMKINSTIILILILTGLISCRSNFGSKKLEDRPIEILKVDSMKFENYYVLEFQSDFEKGKILVKKNDKKGLPLEKTFVNKRFHKYDLCDVIEFLPDNSDIFLRGHSISYGRVYENGELIIDFSNDAEERYYRFCQEDLIKNILKGKVLSDAEPLIGVSLMKKGTAIGTLSNINGDFRLNLDTDEEFELIVNPCCGCYESTEIKIERNTFDVQIDCNCKKSKAVIRKKYFWRGKIKEKKNVIRLN